MFGLVVLEAMAAGRPVVTTAVPSAVREVNLPGVTGLEVPLGTWVRWRPPWTPWPTTRYRRQAMGEAGRKRVREQFTRTLMAERHIALYQRVLAGGSLWRGIGHAGRARVVPLRPRDRYICGLCAELRPGRIGGRPILRRQPGGHAEARGGPLGTRSERESGR